MTLLVEARCELWDGRFTQAEVRYAEFDDIAEDTGFPGGGDINRLHLFALTGREAELRAAVRRTAEMRGSGHGLLQLLAQHALTLFELGQGRYRQALRHARAVFVADPRPAATSFFLCSSRPVYGSATESAQPRPWPGWRCAPRSRIRPGPWAPWLWAGR